MKRYKIEYYDYDRFFSIREISKDEQISAFNHEVFADSMMEGIRKFFEWLGKSFYGE